MTRTLGFVLAAGVLLLGIGWAALLSSSPSAVAQPAPPPRGDVVLIACTGSGTDFKLTAYQGSPGTPAKKSGSCAENLSVLIKDGFLLRDVGQNDADRTGLVVYTLVR
jgi:hypothetical protein